MRRSGTTIGFAALAAAAAVLGGTPVGAVAESSHTRAGAPTRILYLQHDVPAQFQTTLGTLDFAGRSPEEFTSGGVGAVALSGDRLHLGVGRFTPPSETYLEIVDPSYGSQHMINSGAADLADTMALTPGNVVVAGTTNDGVDPKVVELGSAEGDTVVTLLDQGDFSGFPFWVLGADDDRALVMTQTDTSTTHLTVPLDGSRDFTEWPTWLGASQGPGNGPIMALQPSGTGTELVRLAHGATTTTHVGDLPTEKVHGMSWSAKGNKLAIVASWGGKDRLVVVNRAGTDVTTFKKQPGADKGFQAPTLSADGKLLAYQVSKDAGRRTAGLWVRDIPRGKSCRLLAWSKVGYPRPAFSPDSTRVVVTDRAQVIRGSLKLDKPGRSLQELDLPSSRLIGFVGGSSKPVASHPCG